MGRCRGALALVPLVGFTGLWLGTSTAGAAEVVDTRSVTFTNLAGERITCDMRSRQAFDPSRSDTAAASLQVDGPAGCENAYVAINVTFVGPGRVPGSGSVTGGGGVEGTWQPVADDFRSEHSVFFGNCDSDTTRCDFRVVLVQPK
jgi:hypothetical protein